jgi:hypothetical protein
VRTLLVEKKDIERECKIKFNGFFESWKEGRILVSDKQLVVTTERLAHKFYLSLMSVAN